MADRPSYLDDPNLTGPAPAPAPAGTMPSYAGDPSLAAPATPETPERGFWGQLNQRAGSLASGINREGLAVALGAPADFSNYLANLGIRGVNAATGSEYAPFTRPPLGSERLADFMAGTVGETKPEDLTDKILYGAGGALGQTAVGMGVGTGLQALGRAPATAQALIGGPRLTPGVAGSNLSIGGAAGAGSVLGETGADWATGGDPTARAIGGLGGGLAAGVPVGLLPAVARAGAALTAPFRQSGREGLAGQELLRNAGGEVPRLPPEEPLGLNLTLGQRTNDPGILSFERSLEMGATPAQRGLYEADRTRNNQIVRDAMGRLGTAGDPAEHSQYLAGALDTAHQQAREGVTEAYRAIPGATVPTQPLKDNFTTYVSGLTKVRRQFVPDNYEQLLMSLDDHEPMREVMDLRSSLLADERRARSGPQPDYNRANVLRELDSALFKRIPEAGPGMAAPDQAATLAYQRANDLNRDFETTFNAGPMRKVFEGRGFDATVPDSQVAQTLLGSGPGQTERVAQFVKVAGMRPEAMQNARDWFASQLSNKVAAARQDAAGDSFVLANTMRKFVQDNRALINSPVFSPQQRQLVDNIADAVAMQERTARAGARGGSDTALNLAGSRYIDQVVGGWFAPLVEKAGAGAGAAVGGAVGGVPGAAVGYAVGQDAGRSLANAHGRVANQMMDLLHRATRDPDLAIQLMRRANTANDAFVGPALRQILTRSAVPGAMG